MAAKFIRTIVQLDLEEKILNAGALLALAGVFMPWLGGEWLGGEQVTFSGFGFYTSFMGIAVFCMYLGVLLVTVVPAAGGPVLLKKRHRHVARLSATALGTILTLASLSVLTKMTFEFSRMEIRFGIYMSLIGGLVATMYSFLRVQEQRRQQVHELFHHPDDYYPIQDNAGETEPLPSLPPTPPPPPPPEPEEHRVHPRQSVALHGSNR